MTSKKQLTKEQKDFQKAFNTFASSLESSARIVAKMKKTGNPELRAKLVQELKQWDAQQLSAIEAMEQALGHR